MEDRRRRASWNRRQAFVMALALAAMVLLPGAAAAQGTAHQSCEADEGHPCCVIRIYVPNWM